MKTNNIAVSAVVVCLLSSDVQARKRIFEKTENSVLLDSWPTVQQTYVQPSYINHDLCVF